jgi:DNA replication protein DnaC
VACALCDDTGWKTIEVDGVERVMRCDCTREKATEQRLIETRIPPRYQKCSLENFVTYQNEKLLRAVDYAKRFVDAFPVVQKGLMLIGPPGIGKTHIAVSVLRQVVRRTGASGLYYDTRALLKDIRNTYNPVTHTAEMDVIRPVMEAELLVLDDLGAERLTDWVEETMSLIVNTRYNERRATIFTSNYEDIPDDLNSLLVRVGFRLHSRLREMCEFLEYDGPDYRNLPPNAGADDLLGLWKTRKDGSRRASPAGRGAGQPLAALPEKSGGQLRMSSKPIARGKDGKGELKWAGGKAGN